MTSMYRRCQRYNTWKPDETPSFASEERSWPFLAVQDGDPARWSLQVLQSIACRPTSGPGAGFSPAPLPTAERCSLCRSYTLVASGHFVHEDLPESASTDFKVLQRRVRPPVKPVNAASQQLVEGWDFYLWLSETQSGATFEACQSTGPRGKAYCPQIDPAPSVLFI